VGGEEKRGLFFYSSTFCTLSEIDICSKFGESKKGKFYSAHCKKLYVKLQVDNLESTIKVYIYTFHKVKRHNLQIKLLFFIVIK